LVMATNSFIDVFSPQYPLALPKTLITQKGQNLADEDSLSCCQRIDSICHAISMYHWLQPRPASLYVDWSNSVEWPSEKGRGWRAPGEEIETSFIRRQAWARKELQTPSESATSGNKHLRSIHGKALALGQERQSRFPHPQHERARYR
jgi:hypothetical protein